MNKYEFFKTYFPRDRLMNFKEALAEMWFYGSAQVIVWELWWHKTESIVDLSRQSVFSTQTRKNRLTLYWGHAGHVPWYCMGNENESEFKTVNQKQFDPWMAERML